MPMLTSSNAHNYSKEFEMSNAARYGYTDQQYGELIAFATRAVRENGKANTSFLQRAMSISYGIANDIINDLQANGVVGEADMYGHRKVIQAQ